MTQTKFEKDLIKRRERALPVAKALCGAMEPFLREYGGHRDAFVASWDELTKEGQERLIDVVNELIDKHLIQPFSPTNHNLSFGDVTIHAARCSNCQGWMVPELKPDRDRPQAALTCPNCSAPLLTVRT